MRSSIRIAGWVFLAVVAILVVAVPLTIGIRPIIGPAVRPLTDRRFESTPQRLERGRYLANAVAGCVFCHAELDWQRPGFPPRSESLGGGRSWDREGLPWMTAPNITSDVDTGAGAWSDDMIARAVREGIGHDGRALLPLMPYTQYRFMSDEDLAAVVVYIRSLPPLKRRLPPANVPFPVSRFINAVPAPVTEPVPEPERRDPIAYGEYLVRIAACRDCHTPADAQNRPIATMEFGGGFVLTGPYGRVTAANITPAPSGIPYYNADLFVEVMRTGQVKARKIHDAMPWILYSQQTDEDLQAMFAYLRTVGPVKHRVDNSLPSTKCPACGGTHGGGDQNRASN